MIRMMMFSSVLVAVVVAVPSNSVADEPLRAPDVPVLMDAKLFGDQENLNAIGNAGVINNYWEEGPCPNENGGYDECDALRFGLAKYNREDCSPGVDMLEVPDEDGGGDVESVLVPPESNQIDYCRNPNRRHLADGLEQLGEKMFPDGEDAADSTKAEWFERPNLNLTILEDEPAPENAGQTVGALEEACALFEGVPGEVPSMPTWVITVDDESLDFAGMLAAAGGTGTCCDTQANGSSCDPVGDAMDVCEHIGIEPRSDVRDGIDRGRYQCQETDEETWQSGAIHADGGQKHWRCILDASHENCAGAAHTTTDLFGRFSCIRQAPRDAYGGDFAFEMWDEDEQAYVTLPESSYEYIDDQEMLIALNDTYCQGADIRIDPCPDAGANCQYHVDGQPAPGRCGVGVYECPADYQQECRQLFSPMPEVCDGLDNSCDGMRDNIASTWRKWNKGESDGDLTDCAADEFSGGFCFDDGELSIEDVPGYPEEVYESAACFEESVCSCPEGSSAQYVGVGDSEEEEFSDYIRSWNRDAGCYCTTQ